jgi:hypothetical protein
MNIFAFPNIYHQQLSQLHRNFKTRKISFFYPEKKQQFSLMKLAFYGHFLFAYILLPHLIAMHFGRLPHLWTF